MIQMQRLKTEKKITHLGAESLAVAGLEVEASQAVPLTKVEEVVENQSLAVVVVEHHRPKAVEAGIRHLSSRE